MGQIIIAQDPESVKAVVVRRLRPKSFCRFLGDVWPVATLQRVGVNVTELQIHPRFARSPVARRSTGAFLTQRFERVGKIDLVETFVEKFPQKN